MYSPFHYTILMMSSDCAVSYSLISMCHSVSESLVSKAAIICAICLYCYATVLRVSFKACLREKGFVESQMQKKPRRALVLKQVKENLDQSISSILILNTFAHTMGVCTHPNAAHYHHTRVGGRRPCAAACMGCVRRAPIVCR